MNLFYFIFLFLVNIAQRDLMLKRHREAELACETRLHHKPIVQAANKRELEVKS
jgi:hypothetical protein